MPNFKSIHAEFLHQAPGMDGIYNQIERAGRTCYKSNDKIKYDQSGKSLTAKDFVDRIVRVRKHRSVAEHGTIYLIDKQREGCRPAGEWFVQKYFTNPYSKVVKETRNKHEYFYITTNYRVLIENGWEDDLQYLCEPAPEHKKRYTVRLFTDRGVSAESNRHRVNSPSERSTRYVNYEKAGAINVITPLEFELNEPVQKLKEIGPNPLRTMCECISNGTDIIGAKKWQELDYWLFAVLATEYSYMNLIRLGWKPQQARRVLPMCIETELVITAFEDDWIEYFGQRYFGSTGDPHPDKESCGCIMDEFINANLDTVAKAAEKFEK